MKNNKEPLRNSKYYNYDNVYTIREFKIVTVVYFEKVYDICENES